jgi:pimeloyl-ACP methyl ester carboxylesterase
MNLHYGLEFPEQTFVPHAYPESSVNLGEVVLNYVATGPESAPALLLIPSLMESWWAYEAVIKLLEKDFRIYAVDKRGQGRSSRTPGRYALDNWGSDFAHFIERVIKRPTIVAGSSMGGIIAAWLSAYAPPGLVRAIQLENSPFFTSELAPNCGPGFRQMAASYGFELFATHLGDQWAVGDWKGLLSKVPAMAPEGAGEEPPQNLKEFDPESARAFLSGAATSGCNQQQILQSVKTPVQFIHLHRATDPETGIVQGAITDFQVNYARSLVEKAGQRFDYRSLPDKGHTQGLHQEDAPLYASILKEWALALA